MTPSLHCLMTYMNSLPYFLWDLLGCSESYCSSRGKILINRYHFAANHSQLFYRRLTFKVTVNLTSLIVVDFQKIHHFIEILPAWRTARPLASPIMNSILQMQEIAPKHVQYHLWFCASESRKSKGVHQVSYKLCLSHHWSQEHWQFCDHISPRLKT